MFFPKSALFPKIRLCKPSARTAFFTYPGMYPVENATFFHQKSQKPLGLRQKIHSPKLQNRLKATFCGFFYRRLMKRRATHG
jgi:hypothetical protein